MDRSFTMTGFGAVVTGTLISGSVAAGQEMAGLGHERTRVWKSNARRAENTAVAATRVALNLARMDVSELQRGDMLVEPSTIVAVDTIDAEVSLLRTAPNLKHRAHIHFHAFASECMAAVSLYGYRPLEPGSSGLVRLRLSKPLVLLPGDRFVLRPKLIEDADATGDVAAVYDEWQQKSGQKQKMPGILKCFSHRPDFLRDVMKFGDTVHFSEGHLSRRQKEAIASWVSWLNRCPSAAGTQHAYFLRVQGAERKTVQALAEGKLDEAELSPAERAARLCEKKVTEAAYKTTPEDVQILRDHGWTDPADCRGRLHYCAVRVLQSGSRCFRDSAAKVISR